MQTLRQPRLVALASVLLIGGVLWGVVGTTRARGHNASVSMFHPQTDAQSNVKFWESRAKSEPSGVLTQTFLSEAYQARYRMQGDISDVKRAEKAARTALSVRPNARSYTALAATLLTQHQFDAGIIATQNAEKLAGETAQSDYQRGEAYLEKNNLEKATQYIGAGRAKSPTDPFGMALQARLFEKRAEKQDNQAALRLYQEAATVADSTHGMPASSACWFYTRLAACQLHLGDSISARQSLIKALKICPTDWRAQALDKKLP
jgi:tetratricopeptide (TPR) repeat protein